MRGFQFSKFKAQEGKSPFDKLLDIFMELLTHTSGDVDEAVDWLRELDDEYHLTSEDYTIDDFLEELKRKRAGIATPKTESQKKLDALKKAKEAQVSENKTI